MFFLTFECFASDPPPPEDQIENDPCYTAPSGGVASTSDSGKSRAGTSRGAGNAPSMTLPCHERPLRRSAVTSMKIPEDGKEEEEVLLVNNRKRKASRGIHIKDPTEAMPIRQAPPQSWSMMAKG